MGKKQLEALARIIEQQLAEGLNNAVVGSWTIRYDATNQSFHFDKCEDGFYCEERPTIIDVQGNVVDRGGPLLPPAAL